MKDRNITLVDTLEVLLVTGVDSQRFLQGQLTCDVDTLGTSSWIPGAVCNNKGRVISTFLLFRLQSPEPAFALVLAAGMAATLSDHLARFKVFYKVELRQEAESSMLKITGELPAELAALSASMTPSPGSLASAQGFSLLRLPSGTLPEAVWLAFVRNKQADVLKHATTSKAPTRTSTATADGFVLLDPALSGSFTPEELSLDLLGAVSFTKGCYTGQEIVARMHYRGKARKRLFRFISRMDSQAPMTLSGDISLGLQSGEAVNAEIITLSSIADRLEGLVSCRTELQEQTLELKRPGAEPIIIDLRPVGTETS